MILFSGVIMCQHPDATVNMLAHCLIRNLSVESAVPSLRNWCAMPICNGVTSKRLLLHCLHHLQSVFAMCRRVSASSSHFPEASTDIAWSTV